MKNFLLPFTFCLIVAQGFAQVTGTIRTEQNEPLPFANILVLNAADSAVVQGGLSDMEGQFSVNIDKPGSYLVKANMISYQNYFGEPFTITRTKTKIDAGTILLKEETLILEGVQVAAQRMQIEQTMEGTKVNVQSSMAARGSTALQIVERSPGVVLDRRNNNLTLNGQSGTLIMINGRPIRMPQAEIVTMLNGMSADNLESIELLTNPSAKYDADGGAGIINLIVKKSQDHGTNGSAALTAGYGWGPKETVNLSMNHRNGNVNYFGSYTFNHDDTYEDFWATGNSTNPVLNGRQGYAFHSHMASVNTSHNAQAGVEWQSNNQWIMGANALYNQSTRESNIRNDADYFLPDGSFMNADIKVTGLAPTHNLSATLFTEKSFKNGNKLSADLDYIYFFNDSPTEVVSTYTDENGETITPSNELFVEANRGGSTTHINIKVLKVDYTQKLGSSATIDMGIKCSQATTENEAYIDLLVDGRWQRDNRNASDQTIDENIGAAYTTLNWTIDSLTSFSTGVRYEHWIRDFSDETTDSNSGWFFPSAFLSRKLPNHQSLQFAYNRRITRPGYNDLTTYLRYNTAYSVFTGNPSLRPAITDNFKIGYQVKDKNFSLIYTYEQDPLVRYQVAQNEENNLNLIAPQNMAYQRSIGLQFHLPVQITKWWTLTAGGTFSVRDFKVVHTIVPKEKQYLTANLYGSQEFSLPSDIRIELSGFYNAAHYNGSVKNDGFGMLNFGAKKEFDDNSSIQFTVTDVLQSMNVKFLYGGLTEEAWDSTADGTYQPESTNRRIFKVTYYKSFGSNKIKGRSNRRSGSAEERSRVN